MRIDPSELPVSLRYNLLAGAVVPRPIAVVGTMNAAGQLNLAPFSFYNAVSSEPMVLMFCPANRSDGSENDSLRNAKPVAEGGMGCFSVSLAVESHIERVVRCAAALPHGESEFEHADLESAMCERVRAPYMAASPVHFECETIEVRRFAPGVPSGGNMVLGRVVLARVDDALAHARMHIDPARLGSIGRLGGRWYTKTTELFELERG